MEILPDFLIRKGKGYYCPYGDFYIDPLYPVQTAIVSHAHGDHASPGHHTVIASAFTCEFMQYRYSRYTFTQYNAMPFGQHFTIKDVDITLIPAGHISGSAQILMIYKGVRYLYTGDYKLQEDPTCEPIEYVHADVLITETTFADPDVVHPDPVEEIKKLNAISSNILLGCYVMGKAQRITALINAHCPERIVLAHHKILPINRLYEKYGSVPLHYKPYGRKEMKEGPANKVYLVPPLTFQSYFRATKVARVFASGWKRLQEHNDATLYISDHVDWKDILYFIDRVAPREVWTIHGDGSKLREFFVGKLTVREIDEMLGVM